MIVKVLQWNTLAECFSQPDSFPKVDPAQLAWPYRSKLIAKYIADSGCDIFCFQEVDRPEFFVQLFPAEQFEHLYQKKEQNADGTLVVVRKGLHPLGFEVTPYLEEGQPGNQFFLTVKFEHFRLYVTHLKAKAQNEHVRVGQVKQLASKLEGEKLVVTGDFNTQPELEAVSTFIKETGLTSVNTTLPTTSKNRGKIETNIKDYIFYKGIDCLEWELPKLALNENGLPNEYFPSDHMYLKAVFRV